MLEASLEFAKVTYSVRERVPAASRLLLSEISFTVEPGTTTALLGRSGSGKTTLMRMVNALLMPTSGEVRVGGRTTTDWELRALRTGIGYVVQDSGLFPHWTVERNVGLALELAGTTRDCARARVDEVLGMAGLDRSIARRFPWQLSGGQKQRVGVARALAGDPGVLLLDEPFGALDPMTRVEMQTMLGELLSRVRKTVLLVTHDLDEAIYLASRVIFLENGALVADMPSHEVNASTNPYVQRYVAAVRCGGSA